MKTLSYIATFAAGFVIAYALPELPKPTPEPRTIRLDVDPGARETVWSRALADALDGQAEFALPSGRRADVLASDGSSLRVSVGDLTKEQANVVFGGSSGIRSLPAQCAYIESRATEKVVVKQMLMEAL